MGAMLASAPDPIERFNRAWATGRFRSEPSTCTVADVTTNLPTRSPVSFARFLRLIGGVAAATVGLIFLIVGINLLASQQWATATGTVQSCTTSYTGSGSSRHLHRICNIAWQEGGTAHSHSVDFGQKAVGNGQTYQIKVNGNSAVLPSPAWVAILTFLIGAALIGLCIFLVVRSRRRTNPLQ
jgi:hypothetical protein